MDTIGLKTPDPLPFAAWRELSPEGAAAEVHRRLDALPEALRRAAVAWLRPQSDLAAELRSAGRAGLVPPGPLLLHSVPYFLKDLFDLAGVPTLAGSTLLRKIRPAPGRDGTIVARLRAAGAACAGKAHLVEFASGLTGENPHYGDCPHPRFPDRLAGGSSSGSAALVAAGVTPLAMGTDTGGSVRVPAAWCGLFGYRHVPGDPLIGDAFPLAATMDTAGWLTANPADLLTTIRALVGPARTATAEPRGCYLNGKRLVPGMDAAVATACDFAAAALAPRADGVAEASLLLSWNHAVEAYLAIGMSEAHAVHRAWLEAHRANYDPVIWQRFSDAGKLSPDAIAAAHAVAAEIRSVFRDFFRAYDFLLLPAVPCAAPTKAQATAGLRRDILTLTAPASLAGLPVVTLPVALPSGLTAGLQVIVPAADSPVIPWLLERS